MNREDDIKQQLRFAGVPEEEIQEMYEFVLIYPEEEISQIIKMIADDCSCGIF